MTFPRSSLRRITPAAFAVFLAGAIVPRAAFYAHHHADGDHPHVHGDGPTVHEHAHPHPEHVWVPASGSPMLEDGAPDDGRHTHWQSPFQRATTCPAPVLLRGEACVVLAAAEPRRSPADELPPARSRAPPFPLSA